ncbi:MAG: NADH-quinone oxidoreductase subunit M [Planctomycetota bacterium]|nr:NADH-quinone oxidoreductase subunit M [Planctomycetota bacterium]
MGFGELNPQILASFVKNLPLVAVLLPLIGAWLVVGVASFGIDAIRRTALTNSLLTFAVTALVLAAFQIEPSDSERRGDWQMVSSRWWLAVPVETGDATQQFSGPLVRMAFGVDGISVWFVSLTGLLGIAAVLVDWGTDRKHPAVFHSLLLLLQAGLMGTFAALDVILFGVFLIGTLVPMFFLFGWWGGPERRKLVHRLFLLNFAGSVFILAGLVGAVFVDTWQRAESNPAARAAVAEGEQPASHPRLSFWIPALVERGFHLKAGTDSVREIRDRLLPWVFWSLVLGLAIRGAVFPFHSWFPHLVREAPASLVLMFTCVGAKVGCYGLLRFVIPLFPEMISHAQTYLLAPAAIGCVYFGLLALGQGNIKRLFAYAGLCHLSMCWLGVLSLNQVGAVGGMLHAINHGLFAACVILLLAALERRYETTDFDAFGGLAHRLPLLSSAFLFATLAWIGTPFLNGFASQSLLVVGIFRGEPIQPDQPSIAAQWSETVATIFGLTLVAWSLIAMWQRVFMGRIREPILDQSRFLDPHDRQRETTHPEPTLDLSGRELFAVVPILTAIIWLGLHPQFVLSRSAYAIQRISQTHDAALEHAASD